MDQRVDHLLIREGDNVVVYTSKEDIRHVKMTSKGWTNGKSGNWKHTDIIGQPFGAKGAFDTDKVFFMRPSAELWTAGAVEHRTQIIYTPDISVIMAGLGIRCDSVVVEAGTGSGSLSTSIARVLDFASGGRLYTFEYNGNRARAALEDFSRNGLEAGKVTITHRDVCRDGFVLNPGLVLTPEGEDPMAVLPPAPPAGAAAVELADALFLDVPQPWDALAAAKATLREGGFICCFSPCMEQVQRTCEELRKLGFVALKTTETLPRAWTAGYYDIPAYSVEDSSQILFDPLGLGALEQAQDSKGGDSKAQDTAEDAERAGEATKAEQPTAETTAEAAVAAGGAAESGSRKRPREPEVRVRPKAGQGPKLSTHVLSVPTITRRELMTRPYGEGAKGHTSYLTFARKGFAPSSFVDKS